MESKFLRGHVLGKGGFGIVFQSVWDGKEVAVKRITCDDEVDIKTIEKEEAAMKSLNHPNVIKLLYSASDKNFR